MLVQYPPPWITRMRIWDSVRANSTLQNASNSYGSGSGNYYYSSAPEDASSARDTDDPDSENNIVGGVAGRPQYYEYPKPGSSSSSSASAGQQKQQQRPVNIDSAWNPIDTYVYGPTRSTIFNQQPQYGLSAGQLSNNNQQLSMSTGGGSSSHGSGGGKKGANSNNPVNKKGASNWDEQYYQPPVSSGNNNYNYNNNNQGKAGKSGPITKYMSNQYSGTNVIDTKYNTYPGLGGGAAGHHGYDGEHGQGGSDEDVDEELGAGLDVNSQYGHVDGANNGGQFNPYGNINRGNSYAKQQQQQANPNNNNNRNNNRNFNNNPQQQQFHVDGLNRYQTMSTSKSSTSSGSMSTGNYNNNNNNNNNMNSQRGFGYGQTNPGYVGGSKKYPPSDAVGYYNSNNYVQQRPKSGRGRGGTGNGRSGHYRMPSPVDPKRKLLLEIYDNESPKLCDHSALEDATSRKTRPCSPLESYVSTGNDMVSRTL